MKKEKSTETQQRNGNFYFVNTNRSERKSFSVRVYVYGDLGTKCSMHHLIFAFGLDVYTILFYNNNNNYHQIFQLQREFPHRFSKTLSHFIR